MFPPEKVTNSKRVSYQIVDSRNYKNAVKILEEINPDLVLVNGTIDFQNIEIAMASKFKKIPAVVIFFRNFESAKSVSVFKTLKSRLRGMFSAKVIEVHSNTINVSRTNLMNFFFEQYCYLFKTLQALNFSTFQKISFIFSYTMKGLLNYAPIVKQIRGDVNLCSTSKWRNELIKSGFQKSSIFIVGDPFFDKLYNEIHSYKPKHQSTNKKTKVLFCTTTMHGHGLCSKTEEYELIINTAKEILNHQEFELAIKMHPSSASRAEYEELILKKLPVKVKLYQKEDLVELINQNDVLVSYGGSGAILNGVILGKPIVNLNFNTDATINNIWIDDNIITQCKELNSLSSDIKKTKNKTILKEDSQRFIEKFIGIFDGKSSERAADKILQFLEKKDI